MVFPDETSGELRPHFCNVLLIQCKRDGRITPAERDELIAVALWAGARPCIAETMGRKLVLREVDSAGCRRELEV